jgi:ABC transporter, phosphonate, periplasmic substrate-binding protein
MKISTLPAYRLLTVIAAAFVLLTGIPVATQAKDPLKFIGNVSLDKPPTSDTQKADVALIDYLNFWASVKITVEEARDSEEMIDDLVNWKSQEPYVARVTPYAFVVATMLGADLQILATYKSTKPNRSTTYRSYFVVKQSAFPSQPTLDQLLESLRNRPTPARFIYHDKFSTSSYFLPALFFRNNDIYAMPNSINNLKAIISEDINAGKVAGETRFGSAELIKRVAQQQGDEMIIAAVWDDTKDTAADKDKVYFVPLPNVLPNDLFVCAAKADSTIKENLLTAIQHMPETQINVGDFKTWLDIDQARDTRQALSELSHLAEQRSTAVTIKITNSSSRPVDRTLEEEIKHAIRLSNTEFTVFDPSYHANNTPDVDWTIETIHDGAIKLVSQINRTGLDPQEFEISFTPGKDDLSKKVSNIIHSRMHRIRYVWPYKNVPTVIRDVEFPVLPNSVFKVRGITWTDPKRNGFEEGNLFDASVILNQNPDARRFSFQLAGSGFPTKFDPLSNISYRVILIRQSREAPIFTALTYIFVGLLGLSAIGAVFDMRRRAKKNKDLPLVDIEDFTRTCRELAAKYRSCWRKHELTEADVLWCDRDRLETIIADLKSTAEFNAVKTRTRSMAILANVPVVSKFLGLTVGGGMTRINTTDPTKFSDAQRLEDALRYLIDENALSPFIGERLEWDALNQIAANIFEPFSLATSQAGKNNGDAWIKTENPMVVSLIAKHFNSVIQESKDKVCFFGRKWTVTANETEQMLVCTSELLTPIRLNGGNSAVPKMVQKLTLRAQVSRDADLGDVSQNTELSAWVFGKIHRVDPPRNGDGNLFLTFRPAALVRTDDSE